MSSLSAFLHPVTRQEEREIVVSRRFIDENGSPAKWRIRSLTQAENDQLRRAATRRSKVNGQWEEKMDSAEYSNRLIVAAVLEPDLHSKELCDGYGVVDPLALPSTMLTAGEYARLSGAILEISGFDDTEAGAAALDEEVKN